jgi:hypothetical protein
MISLDDIARKIFVGRPRETCDFLKRKVLSDPEYLDKLECKFTIDTSLLGNLPIYNMVQAYKFIFIPVDFIEHKIISSGMIQYLESVKGKILLRKDIEEIEKIISSYNDKSDNLQNKYRNEESILVYNCFMFVFSEKGFADVYTVKPITLLVEVLLGSQEYKCSKCKKILKFKNTNIGNLPPDLMYKLSDREVEYYCNDCAGKFKIEGLKHVGEKAS